MRANTPPPKTNTPAGNPNRTQSEPRRGAMPGRAARTGMGVYFDPGGEPPARGAMDARKQPPRRAASRRKKRPAAGAHTVKQARDALLTAALLIAFAVFAYLGGEALVTEKANDKGPLTIVSLSSPQAERAASDVPAMTPDAPEAESTPEATTASVADAAPVTAQPAAVLTPPRKAMAAAEPTAMSIADAAAVTAKPTAIPTPPRKAAATPAVAEARVWMPKSGARYHANPDCSGMQDPLEATVAEAKQQGLTPCKRCNPPE